MGDRLLTARLDPADPTSQNGGDVHVSFIVPAFSAERTLAACIASIRAAAPPGSEIIVVDDGALDDTPRLAKELADKVVHRPCQGGAARSRNDGTRVAEGDILFFVDADVTVTKDAVLGALAHLGAGADAAFGAYEPLPPPHVRNVATNYKNILHHYTHLNGARVATTFWSGFGTIRREAFVAVGGFDPAVTTGADVEDIHLGYRLRAAGFKIVLDPGLQVQHHKRYTVRGVVASDIFHRAIPWTRAILELRSVSLDLNLRVPAMLGSVIAYAALVAAAATPFLGPLSLSATVAFLAVWISLNRSFLGYTRRQWGLAGSIASAGLLYLYSLYCLIGVGLGVFIYLLRGRSTPSLNWLRLDGGESDQDVFELGGSTPTNVVVSVAVIVDENMPVDSLAGLPAPAPWWELIVVSPDDRTDLPPGARFVRAGAGGTRQQMRQRALEVSKGEMFCTLDSYCVPDPAWLERVRIAAGSAHVAVGGSFRHDRRGVRARAAQIGHFWSWRPERAPTWLTEHPVTNSAYRRDVALAFGGFADEIALLPRLAALGARPLRFDPAMSVQLTGPVRASTLVFTVSRGARNAAAASCRYLDYGIPSRALLVSMAPMQAAVQLVRIVRAAVAEGSAGPTFWLALPMTAAAVAGFSAGRAAGFLRPGHRGGSVPRTADDLAGLAVPVSEALPP